MRKTLLYCIAVAPLVLYIIFKRDLSFIASELPESTAVQPFYKDGKPYYAVFARYHEESENAMGRTQHSMTEELLVIDPAQKEIIQKIHLPGNIAKLSGSFLWSEDSKHGLHLTDPVTAEVVLVETELSKTFPQLKEQGYSYAYADSTWTVKYKDGSEVRFNENQLPLIQKNKAAAETSYLKRWSVAQSSGERSYLVYQGKTSKQDLLKPAFVSDSYTGNYITLQDGAQCLISFQKELNGPFYFGLADTDANLLWTRTAKEFASNPSSYYLVKDATGHIVSFRTDKMTVFDLRTGNLSWELSMGGSGFIPQWLFITLTFAWLAIFICIAEGARWKKASSTSSSNTNRPMVSNRTGRPMN